MSTSLANARIEASKQLGDYWAGTTTSAGAAGGTTIVDTALKAKANDWVDTEGQAYDLITQAADTSVDEERLISSLDNSTGTLTVLAHSGQIGSAKTYEVHRLFTASEKRRALIAACREAFPAIYERVWTEEFVSKNWLKDGSLERWTTTTNLTDWTETTVTATQTSTAGYVKHGTYSCKLDTATGYISQSITNHADLMRLAGKTVTLSAQVHCNTASACRLGILYDGTNLEYSDYHDGDSTWTEDAYPLEVTKTISDNPTDISFRVYLANASATAYVDDLRVIAEEDYSPRIYVGHLGLAQNQPVQVFIEHNTYSQREPWILIPNVDIDYEGGWMYLPSGVAADYRVRVKGIGYLDFLASGASSTAWTATVNIDQPQLDILVAQAILYLYQEMSVPNFTQGTRRDFQEMIAYWERELSRRIGKYGMETLSVPVKYR